MFSLCQQLFHINSQKFTAVIPTEKPNDPERSRTGVEVEWRGSLHFVLCQGNSSPGTFSRSLDCLPLFQTFSPIETPSQTHAQVS